MKIKKSLDVIVAIFTRSLFEYCSRKLFAILILITVFLIYFSLLVGIMAVDYEKRVLMDLGLGFIELMSFAYLVYISATSISEEIQSKTIYLVFSRPVARLEYLLAKFLSLFALAAVIVFYSGVFHLLLLHLRGFLCPAEYFVALAMIWCKLSIISAITLFFSLLSTSPLTPIIASLIIWMGGHMTPEIKFLIEKAEGFSAFVLNLSRYVLPNFQLYNLRDTLQMPPHDYSLYYMLSWILAMFALSGFVFRKKEF